MLLFTFLFASLVYIPTEFLLEQLFEPLAIYNVGIFLPLMVANSLIVRKSETRFFVQKKGPMVLDLLCSVIGIYVGHLFGGRHSGS